MGTLGITNSTTVFAATSPSLGAAGSYSILAGSDVTNTGATTISGDVGISPGIGAPPHFTGFGTVTLGGVIHDADGAAATAQNDENTAYTALASQGCDTDYGAVTTELAGKNLVPGVYCSNSFHLTAGTLTLNGSASDVWIFKSASDLIVTGGAAAKVIFTGGGLPCNVWWRVVSSATFDANSSLVGNILADTSITFASGASLNGRALARTAEVTLSSNTISGPTCTSPPPVPPVPPVPLPLPITTYVSGTIVPVIGILKVPEPLALPAGPGPVTYNYTVFNVGGQQALVNVKVTDDKCSPVVFISGDLNNDGKLDFHENWKYSCTTTLANTTTNTAIATGYSDSGNPQTAIATAVATVVVGLPSVPPLINIIKIPSQLTPFPYGGGSVTYRYTVTNPGVIAMHDVAVTDDKCAPVSMLSGDVNNNGLLDPGEIWIYTCRTTIAVSTRNTATAEGNANGFTAVSYAFATVLVSAPVQTSGTSTSTGFPNTGFPPVEGDSIPWNIPVLAGSLFLGSVTLTVISKKRAA